jgi:hypothetical protein
MQTVKYDDPISSAVARGSFGSSSRRGEGEKRRKRSSADFLVDHLRSHVSAVGELFGFNETEFGLMDENEGRNGEETEAEGDIYDNDSLSLLDDTKQQRKSSQQISETENEDSSVGGISGIGKKKKEKKKKKKKKKKTGTEISESESELESEVEGKKKSKKLKKKKKKKKKKRSSSKSLENGTSASESERDIMTSGTDHGRGRGRRSGESEDETNGEPKIIKRKVRRLGKKLDPEEWTREELMERVSRLGIFEIDRLTGYSKLTIEHRRLLDEEMKILIELFRRNTEIQSLTFRKCYLTDEILEELITRGFSKLRHIRILNLNSNALTRNATQLLITTYQHSLRPIESIDVRENIMNNVDSTMLYQAFSASLTFLNGILLSKFQDQTENRFDCANLKGHLIETGVVCAVLNTHLSFDALDLSRNLIDSNCLILLSQTLRPLTNIHRVILNYNPLVTSIGGVGTEGGETSTGGNSFDLRGITEFMKMLRVNQFIFEVEMVGCKVPPKMQENIERSLMVNRSMEGMLRGQLSHLNLSLSHTHSPLLPPSLPPLLGNRFNVYIADEFHSRDQREKKSVKSLWRPSLTLDPYFLMSKNSPVSEIDAVVEGDRIILPKGVGGRQGERRQR